MTSSSPGTKLPKEDDLVSPEGIGSEESTDGWGTVPEIKDKVGTVSRPWIYVTSPVVMLVLFNFSW